MPDTHGEWVWSPAHNQHYRFELKLGKYETIWEKAGESAPTSAHVRKDSIQSASSHAAIPRTILYATSTSSDHQDYDASNPIISYHTHPTGLSYNQEQSPSYEAHSVTHASTRPNHTHHDSLPYKYADLAFITPVGSSYNPPQSGLTTQNQHPATERSGQTNLAPNAPPIRNSVPSRGRGLSVKGSWGNGGMNYEELDQSFYVRHRNFFTAGKVLAVLFTEPAGSTVTAYNTSISTVKFNELVHTQIRRFIVVRAKKEFCYACPIFTYKGQGTLKQGVRPEEHAIAHSLTEQAVYLPDESGMTMLPICIINAPGIRPLDPASRIYFGIHHPIQYNVKVQHVGDVHPDHLLNLRRYWNSVNQEGSNQDQDVTAAAQSNDEKEFNDVSTGLPV